MQLQVQIVVRQQGIWQGFGFLISHNKAVEAS